MTSEKLNWIQPEKGGYQEAQLGFVDDGVGFCLTHHPTCYRRGQWRLLIEVCGGKNHTKWGCFDDADQPMRNYHNEERAKDEAQAIAKVLWDDRLKVGSIGEQNEQEN